VKRLILFPEKPGSQSGYQKAVAADWERICPQFSDTVICYATLLGNAGEKWSQARIILRPSALSTVRVINLLQRRVSAELRPGLLSALTERRQFDEIFCGEVVFYRALKELYPHVSLHVRFHNLFLVSQTRNQVLKYQLPLAARLNLYLLTRLEKEILADRKVVPIFITEEEYRFFKILYPLRTAHVWPVVGSADVAAKCGRKRPDATRLIWYGSLSHHKKYALAYFIQHVYKPLRIRMPQLELHLFGKGSDSFRGSAAGITAHGYYSGASYPFEGNALFINPDLLGGGIKLKIEGWLREGIPFISTPFGVEGYQIRENDHVIIKEISEWDEAIYSFFNC